MPEYRRTLPEVEVYSGGLLDNLRVNRRALAARSLPAGTGDQACWPGRLAVLALLADVGCERPRYRSLRVALRRFPERETLHRAARLGARWIVVHFDEDAPGVRAARRAAIREAPGLVPVARFGGDAVFRLALPPSP